MQYENIVVPEGCICGSPGICHMHLNPEDFVVGTMAYVNPYTYAKHGSNGSLHGLRIDRGYRITAVTHSESFNGTNTPWVSISIDHPEARSREWHHGYFIPDPFVAAVREAKRQSEAKKADRKRYRKSRSK